LFKNYYDIASTSIGYIRTWSYIAQSNTVVCITLFKQELKMHVLKLTFLIVIFVGCFRPLSWTSPFKRTIYSIYRIFIITLLYTFAFFQIMYIILNAENPDDFTDTLHMMLNVSVSGYKLLIMWINYNDVKIIINKLNEEPFKPLDEGELEIREKFDQIIR